MVNISKLKVQYKEHQRLLLEIIDSINKTGELLTEFSKLKITGVKKIDDLYFALKDAHTTMVEIFETLE